jgi:hypothetical protein
VAEEKIEAERDRITVVCRQIEQNTVADNFDKAMLSVRRQRDTEMEMVVWEWDATSAGSLLRILW